MERDPRATLAESPMTPAQIVAVIITIALNGLDGFDVLAISFASSRIAVFWLTLMRFWPLILSSVRKRSQSKPGA